MKAREESWRRQSRANGSLGRNTTQTGHFLCGITVESVSRRNDEDYGMTDEPCAKAVLKPAIGKDHSKGRPYVEMFGKP